MFEYDVVIVGAGLAGLRAANELGREHRRVLLVDVKASVDRSVHTTGIFVRRTLEDFALPEDCLGPPIGRVVLHSPAGRQQVLESGRAEYRVGRMERLYLRLLESAEAKGVEWQGGTRYGSSAAIPGGSAVWLERSGRRWRVRTRVLIGADGAVSRVSRDLELAANREWIVGVEDVLEGTLGVGRPTMHCILDPELAPGYIAWLVDDGEQIHAGVGGYASRFDPAAALARLYSRLERMPEFAGLSGHRRVQRRGGRIPVNGILGRIGCERGVLIGDAAGAVSPLTAGGLDPCVRLTGLATTLVGQVLDGAPAGTLNEYSGGPFQRHFLRRRLTRRVFGSMGLAWQVEAACRVLRTPAGSVLAKRLFFGRGSFPDIGLAVRGGAVVPASQRSAAAREVEPHRG